MKSEDRKSFLERIKCTVDISKINNEKDLNQKKNGDSSPPNKGQKERTREPKGHSRAKMFSGNENSTLNEFLDPSNFSRVGLVNDNYFAFIESVIRLESKYLNIVPPEYMLYRDEGDNSRYGFYSPDTYDELLEDGSVLHTTRDTIYINAAKPLTGKKNYRSLVNTLIHEVRHKYQNVVTSNFQSYPEVTFDAKKYLEYSDQNYNQDIETQEGYDKNGLEADARGYAASRTELYMRYSVNEILELENAPTKSIHNQILMESGYAFENGKRAPITVSQTFFSDDFSTFQDDEENCTFEKGSNKDQVDKLNTEGDANMAEMTGGTDFSERAQNEAAKVYGSMIENIQSFSEKVIEYFVERVKIHPYKQLENVGNVFIRYYNEELPNEIKNAISDWISSENSFSASLKEQYEGDEVASISAAEKTQNKLLEQVDSCFKIIPPIKISLPISIDKERIISDAVYVENISKELANVKDFWLERFSKCGEQNSLYATMMPMVASTFTKVEAGYHATYKDIMNVSEEFRDARNVVFGRDITAGKERSKNVANITDKFRGTRRNIH